MERKTTSSVGPSVALLDGQSLSSCFLKRLKSEIAHTNSLSLSLSIVLLARLLFSLEPQLSHLKAFSSIDEKAGR